MRAGRPVEEGTLHERGCHRPSNIPLLPNGTLAVLAAHLSITKVGNVEPKSDVSSLVVLAFDDEQGAEQMRDRMYDFQKRELITLEDAAVVVRQKDGKAKVKQAHSLVGAGALGGAFWGLLIGLIFFMPWLGLAIGAVTGALSGKMADIGIDDDFIKQVSETVEPGTSALFLLARDANLERIKEELKDVDFKVIETNLTPEQEQQLRDTFAAEEIAG